MVSRLSGSADTARPANSVGVTAVFAQKLVQTFLRLAVMIWLE